MRQNSTTAANGFYSRWSSCVKIFGKPKDANETVKYGQRFVALSSKSQAPHLSKLENGNCQKLWRLRRTICDKINRWCENLRPRK
jgi:hypothetical protein